MLTSGSYISNFDASTYRFLSQKSIFDSQSQENKSGHFSLDPFSGSTAITIKINKVTVIILCVSYVFTTHVQQWCQDPESLNSTENHEHGLKPYKNKKGDEISPEYKSFFGNCPRRFGTNGHVRENLISRVSWLGHSCGKHLYIYVYVHTPIYLWLLQFSNTNVYRIKRVTYQARSHTPKTVCNLPATYLET